MAKAKRRASSSGTETRQRIVEATIDTLRTQGIVGASARAIARQGDFNQALIFYHFGSVDDAIVEAIGELSARRLDRYKTALVDVATMADLVEVARRMVAADQASGEVRVLAQAFAGASGDPEMGPRLFTYIEDWNQLISEVIDRVVAESPLADSPLVAALPRDELAFAVSAMFLGIEMMVDLDPGRTDVDRTFTAIAGLAQIGEGLMRHPEIRKGLGL